MKKRLKAQDIILDMLGETVEVVEAKKPFGFRVCPRHYVVGTECDPINCTLANAMKEHPDVSAAIVLQCVSYILFKSDPKHLHRYDNRGTLHRVVKPEKLIAHHDTGKLQIPSTGLDVIIYPSPSKDRLVRNKTKAQIARARQEKADSARRNKDKPKRRRYRKSISSIRKNMLSSFIVGAMSAANKKRVSL